MIGWNVVKNIWNAIKDFMIQTTWWYRLLTSFFFFLWKNISYLHVILNIILNLVLYSMFRSGCAVSITSRTPADPCLPKPKTYTSYLRYGLEIETYFPVKFIFFHEIATPSSLSPVSITFFTSLPCVHSRGFFEYNLLRPFPEVQKQLLHKLVIFAILTEKFLAIKKKLSHSCWHANNSILQLKTSLLLPSCGKCCVCIR